MAKCDYCGGTIIFGGVRDGNFRFCNDKCHQQGYVLSVANQIPEDVVRKSVLEIHAGACPSCGGRGPVDVHTFHQVYSVLFLTSWKSTPQVSCRSCGVKGMVKGTISSLLLGWWGFPWGFIMTPVQVVRNINGLLKGNEDAYKPSNQLEKIVRIWLAQQHLRKSAPRG